VRPVSDSRKAADIVGLEKFDGIFLDVEMPNMNGFDLARTVRKSPRINLRHPLDLSRVGATRSFLKSATLNAT
jgi:CheY-like chemotaxis protein